MIRLDFEDGLVLRISHDPAFAPNCGPCRLRDALARGDRGHWMRRLVSAELSSPFVTVRDDTLITWVDEVSSHAAVTVDGEPSVLATWLRGAEPPGGAGDVTGSLVVQPVPDTNVVTLEGGVADEDRLAAIAAWIAAHAPGRDDATE